MSALVALGDICRPKQWPTLSKAQMKKTGYPVYGANGKIGFYDSFTHEMPTLLIGCRGSCGTVVVSEPMSYVNGNAMALDNLDSDRVDLGYLCQYFKHRGFQDVITGTSQPQIIGLNLKRVEVPLPPLAEQRRIASILDKADALRAKRRLAIAKLDQLLQSVFLEMFGDPVTNPKRWHMSTIGAECTVGSGSTPSRTVDQYFSGVIPWVKSTEVDWGTIVDTSERISQEGQRAARLKMYVPGTIVVALYGQGKTRGKCAVLGMPATMNQACAGVVPRESVNGSFLFHYLKLSYLTLRGESRGGNQENLNLEILKSFGLPMPPIEMQNRFARLASVLANRQAEQSSAGMKLDRLFASAQTQAFCGEL